jgi:DNA polymerase III delta prime subunit
MLLSSAAEWKPQPLNWLIPGVLCDSLTLISGEPKMGKTLFAANLARSLINQTEVLNQQPKKGNFRVAWMGFDMDWQQEFTNTFGDITDYVWFCQSINYKRLDLWKELQRDTRLMNINLLIIDHLHGYAPAVDLNYAHFVDEAFLPIEEFFETTGIPILLLHHGNKSGSGRAANSALIEAKARLLGRISSSRGKHKTIEFIGNQIETFKVNVLIKPEGIEVNESKKAEKKKTDRDDEGVLITHAKRFLEESPLEVRKSARAAGKWLHKMGLSGSEGAGRTKINNMLTADLLKRDGNSGYLVAGHKLLY